MSKERSPIVQSDAACEILKLITEDPNSGLLDLLEVLCEIYVFIACRLVNEKNPFQTIFGALGLRFRQGPRFSIRMIIWIFSSDTTLW